VEPRTVKDDVYGRILEKTFFLTIHQNMMDHLDEEDPMDPGVEQPGQQAGNNNSGRAEDPAQEEPLQPFEWSDEQMKLDLPGGIKLHTGFKFSGKTKWTKCKDDKADQTAWSRKVGSQS